MRIPLASCFLLALSESLISMHLVMSSRKMSVTEAASLLSDSESRCQSNTPSEPLLGIPFFNLTDYLRKQLELYEACDYQPREEHPLVQESLQEKHRVKFT